MCDSVCVLCMSDVLMLIVVRLLMIIVIFRFVWFVRMWLSSVVLLVLRKLDSMVMGNGCFIVGFMMICINGKDEKVVVVFCWGVIGLCMG